MQEYDFTTLTFLGATIAPELIIHSDYGGLILRNPAVMLPLFLAVVVAVIIAILFAHQWRRRVQQIGAVLVIDLDFTMALNSLHCVTDCPKPSDSSSRAALLEQDQSQQQRHQPQQHHVPPHHLNKQPQSFQAQMPNNHCPTTRHVALLPGIQSTGAIPVQYGTLRRPRTGTELQQMAANATLDRSLLQKQHSDVCLMG